MTNEMIKLISSQGIWAMLSFFLIYYILKAQESRDAQQALRESKYQEIITSLSEKFEVIHSDLQELKKK